MNIGAIKGLPDNEKLALRSDLRVEINKHRGFEFVASERIINKLKVLHIYEKSDVVSTQYLKTVLRYIA